MSQLQTHPVTVKRGPDLITVILPVVLPDEKTVIHDRCVVLSRSMVLKALDPIDPRARFNGLRQQIATASWEVLLNDVLVRWARSFNDKAATNDQDRDRDQDQDQDDV